VAQHKTASKSGGKGRASKRSTKKAEGSRPGRTASAHKDDAIALGLGGDDEVAIDRRRSAERRDSEQSSGDQSSKASPQLERRKKVNRRRQIDPTTCERDYTEEEVEFMNALDDYKRKSGRMFPTCSEVLEVVRGLGYAKLPLAELDATRGTSASTMSAKPMPTNWDASAATEAGTDDDGSDLSREPEMAY
jgi:hypothetical protein